MKHLYEHDVFISHAYEDKDEIGNPLYELLCNAGLRVWYSGKNMRVGEDLTETIIHKVIPNCEYGVVIISNNYFKASWGRKELNALHTFEQSRGYKIILPVWHNVDEDAVAIEFPYLVGRFAVRSDKGIEIVTSELIKVITTTPPPPPPPIKSPINRELWSWLIWTISIIAVFVLGTLLILNQRDFFKDKPPEDLILNTVEARIHSYEARIEADYRQWLEYVSAEPIRLDSLVGLIHLYTENSDECKSNEYFFDDNHNTIHGTKKVSDCLGYNTSGGLYSAYGMKENRAFLQGRAEADHFSYILINQTKPQFKIEKIVLINEEQAICKVSYEHMLRYVKVDINGIQTNAGCLSMRTTFYGLKQQEEYVFEKEGTDWKYTGSKR